MRINMKSKTAAKNLDELFKEFILNCRVRNLSNRTIEYYETAFSYFSRFFPQSNQVNTITREVTDKYILYLKNETKLNDISINTMLRGVRVFLYYIMDLGYIDKFKIDFIKTEKQIKETYSDNELSILLKKPNIKKCNFAEFRNWVIVNYLISTGNRADTIINIQLKDIDFDNDLITLQKTKNKKQQVIPMSNTLHKILREYIQFRKGSPQDYLFCNVNGDKLTYNALRLAISKYNKSRGIEKTSIHLFRHTFAKKYLLSGGDVFRLQKLLGHSDLEIVKNYINLFSDDLKIDYNKLNPLEQISQKNFITIN